MLSRDQELAFQSVIQRLCGKCLAPLIGNRHRQNADFVIVRESNGAGVRGQGDRVSVEIRISVGLVRALRGMAGGGGTNHRGWVVGNRVESPETEAPTVTPSACPPRS